MTLKILPSRSLLLILAALWATATATAMEIITHAEGFIPGSHRLELRDLGFEGTDRIPADESAITALAETPNGDIYIGTTAGTGLPCHLLVFSPRHDRTNLLRNRVKHLGKIPGHESIHHSLVAGKDGVVYIGTGRNEIMQHPISAPPVGYGGITQSLRADIWNRYKNYKGGHLYKYDPAADQRDWVAPDQPCPLEDLGIPVPNNGIYAMTINTERGEIYGITYPDGHFFVYQIKSRKCTDLGKIYQKIIFADPDNRTLRSITAALICDDLGHVWGSADDSRLFRYDPDGKKPARENIKMLDVAFPSIYYSAVESFAKGPDGAIYGGTVEGYLFRLDPETMKVSNLGKPAHQWRVRALAAGKDGMIYGMSGQRSDHCRAFSYDPDDRSFRDLGILKVVRDPYYQWSALQTDAMLAARDGLIYIGESERRSHLILFYP